MTKEKQIIAIAGLDGWSVEYNASVYIVFHRDEKIGSMFYEEYAWNLIRLKNKNLLTSRDAIIPVIEKQSSTVKTNIVIKLYQMNCIQSGDEWCNDDVINVLLSTPEQLAEALLRETGKWEQ